MTDCRDNVCTIYCEVNKSLARRLISLIARFCGAIKRVWPWTWGTQRLHVYHKMLECIRFRHPLWLFLGACAGLVWVWAASLSCETHLSVPIPALQPYRPLLLRGRAKATRELCRQILGPPSIHMSSELAHVLQNFCYFDKSTLVAFHPR
jgi:hypothetical protein